MALRGKRIRNLWVICVMLSFFRSPAAADTGTAPTLPRSVSLSGDVSIYGIEGAFSGDVYVKISVSGYTKAFGSLHLEGLISNMSSAGEYVMEDSPLDLQLRFPAELINELHGGVHNIIASSWNFQGRSDVVIPPTMVGRLFIKTATPIARIDYDSERLTRLRHSDGNPYYPKTNRQAYYAIKRGNETVTGAPDRRGTLPIPEEWMTGDPISIIHLNEMESLNSERQTIVIPARPPAPRLVFAFGETSPGAGGGMIIGVTEAMEYSADGGTSWSDCPPWVIKGLAPADYSVRMKAVDKAAFAGRQRKVTVKAAPPAGFSRARASLIEWFRSCFLYGSREGPKLYR